LFDEVAAGLERAAGGQEVVHQQDAGLVGKAVHVDLEFGTPVLQVILEGVRSVGEFARLPQGDQRLFQGQGQRGGRKEAAGVGGGNRVDVLPVAVGGHDVNGFLKRGRFRQERRNVLELNSRFGKIRDVADVLRQVHRLSFPK